MQMHTNCRYIQVGGMIGAYHVGAAPINGFFKGGTIKNAGGCRAYKGNKLPQLIDVPVKFGPFRKQDQNRPEKYKKEPYTVSVERIVYPF